MLTIDYEYENKNFQIQLELIECPISLEISKNPVLCLRAHFRFLLGFVSFIDKCIFYSFRFAFFIVLGLLVL